jgi:predicted dinucleotide-binding enzyme
MRVGILGSGLMGGKLGTLFARAGHEVVFSYARSKEKLNKLARDAQGNARAGTPGDARSRRTHCCSPCTGRASPTC